MVRRTKTKYFNNGKLIWEENTSAGKYVRENCKVIKVDEEDMKPEVSEDGFVNTVEINDD